MFLSISISIENFSGIFTFFYFFFTRFGYDTARKFVQKSHYTIKVLINVP
jgi:hypothetical protein